MLDTNIFIYVRKNQPISVLTHLKKIAPSHLCMSSITFAELMYGANKSQYSIKNLALIKELKLQVPVLAFDETAAELYGIIRTDLERRGELIGSNDLLIAAHALSIGAVLITNIDF